LTTGTGTNVIFFHHHLHKGIHIVQKCIGSDVGCNWWQCFLCLLTSLCFILQEGPDLTAMGTTFGVAQTPTFSTGEEHEITTLLPGNDQHH